MPDTGSRLVLGTAQWGSAYGVTNARGALTDADVAAVVEEALARGVTMADTHRTTDPAHGYGRALSRLRPWASRFRITTKVFGGPSADLPALAQLEATLEELGVPAVHACLVHDWPSLDDATASTASRHLEALRASGRVEMVGVSAYDDADLVRARDAFGVVDLVQVPASALDRRMERSLVLREMHDGGTVVEVRSIFLQGLLARRSDSRLGRHPDVEGFHDWCQSRACSGLVAALAYARSLPWAARVVVGATSGTELQQICDAWSESAVPDVASAPQSDDAELIDPRRWPAWGN